MASKKGAKKKGAGKKANMAAVQREDSKKVNMKKTNAIAKEAPKKSLPTKKETSKVGRFQGAQKFFRGVISELKKVHWPNRREVITYTSVVLASVAFVAVLIWIFDSVLSQVLKLVL